MDGKVSYDDQKQMIKHLQKRIQDHVKEKNSLIEINEDLEEKFNKKEKLLNEVSDYHKKARNDHKEELFKVLKKKEISEKVIKDLQTENNELKREIENIELKRLLGEIEDLKEKNNEKENMIKSLKTENDDKLKKLETCMSENSYEFHQLVKEIEQVQKINQEKEDQLNAIEKEKDQLKEKLVELEKEKDASKELLVKEESESESVKNLSDELGIIDQRAHNVSPACDLNDESPEYLKNHIGTVHGGSLAKKIWTLKVTQLEQSISSQKLKLASDILKLKENEDNENKLCTCKSFCRIVHQKHNWKKSFSKEIFNKFKDLDKAYSCNFCDNTFQNVDCLKLHMRSIHLEKSTKEGHNGRVIVKNPSIPSCCQRQVS